MRRALLIAAINKKNGAEPTGSRCRPINALVIPRVRVYVATRIDFIRSWSQVLLSLPSAAGISQIDFRPRRSLITRPPLLIRTTAWSRNQIRSRFRRIQRTLSGNHRRFLDRSFRVSRLGVMSIIFFFNGISQFRRENDHRRRDSINFFTMTIDCSKIVLLTQRKDYKNRWKGEEHNPERKYGLYTQLLFINSTNNYSSFGELSQPPTFPMLRPLIRSHRNWIILSLIVR